MEILRVENLTKAYGSGNNKVVALDNVSFSVEKGLSLAKKIILMDNGKISVESKKNEYTIFKIKYFK